MSKLRRDGNLSWKETDMSVHRFLGRELDNKRRVAGLLDHGYDEREIARIMDTSLENVRLIKQSNRYLSIKERTEVEGRDE